jgi:hypothetical protein
MSGAAVSGALLARPPGVPRRSPAPLDRRAGGRPPGMNVSRGSEGAASGAAVSGAPLARRPNGDRITGDPPGREGVEVGIPASPEGLELFRIVVPSGAAGSGPRAARSSATLRSRRARSRAEDGRSSGRLARQASITSQSSSGMPGGRAGTASTCRRRTWSGEPPEKGLRPATSS